MEKTLIIYYHPYSKSFNHAIKEKVESNFMESGKHFSTINLYAEQFNPAYTSEELALFKEGKKPIC